MDLRLFSLAFVTAMSFALAGFAIAPPLPSLTNGDGSVAHNGMKHASISLTDTMLAVHVSDPPPTPVTMMSGYGVDYTPDKFNVLENVYFNAQHGWLPGGILSPPAGGNIWIKRIGVTQPALAITHDEVMQDALVRGAPVHLGQVGRILRLVFEECVHELDRLDTELTPRHPGKIEMIQLAGPEGPMQRPLGQRDAERLGAG